MYFVDQCHPYIVLISTKSFSYYLYDNHLQVLTYLYVSVLTIKYIRYLLTALASNLANAEGDDVLPTRSASASASPIPVLPHSLPSMSSTTGHQ